MVNRKSASKQTVGGGSRPPKPQPAANKNRSTNTGSTALSFTFQRALMYSQLRKRRQSLQHHRIQRQAQSPRTVNKVLRL